MIYIHNTLHDIFIKIWKKDGINKEKLKIRFLIFKNYFLNPEYKTNATSARFR